MGYVWHPAVIGGVAAGGAVFLFSSICIFVVIILKVRHRRMLAAINAAGERRLSRYPGGNLNIADGEFSQVPDSKGFLRPSAHDPYGASKDWTAISSRESIHSRPMIKNPPKAAISDRVQQQNDPSHLSWPLPRRLTRSKAIPLVPIRELALSPITERSATNPEPSPAMMSATGFPMEKPLEETTDTVGKALSSDRNGSPQTSVWPGAALKPKPLFHGQQRSSSAGSIPQRPSDNIAPLLTAAGNPRDSFPFPSHRSEFPRSVSLASRSSGVAPDGPVPPLPANVRKSNRPDRVRVNAAGSPSRTSVGSCGSGHSSILQDRASQATSQAETDFTSLNLLSPHSGLRIYDGSKIWDSSRMSSTATSPGPSTTTNIQTQFLTQRSFRASIEQYSLPRSTSSGLSMSLLDEHTPKAESKISKAGSISRSLSVSHSARNLEVPKRNLVRQQSARERTLASLTSNRNSVFNIYDDVRNKRASTSILQDVSGNEGSPLRNELGQRPTSIATSNPFQWDPATSMKPEQLAAHKGWRRGHKRQNCVRISNITPRSTPGRFLPTLEEPAEQSRAPDQKNGALHRPPSQPTFDPTIRPPSRSSKTRHPSKSEGTYSPTLAMVNLYSSDSGSSDSSTSNPTPTRKPSHRRTPSQRRRNLFSSASKITAWPAFSTPSKGVPKTTLPPSLPENQTQSPDLPTPTLSLSPHPFSAPSNFFRNNRNNHPNESSIRGPRAPPSPVRMYQRTTGTSRAEKRLSPMRDLRRSVMALRRMNSEVSESEARASQRYLRMGGESPLLDEWMMGAEEEGGPSVRSGLGREGPALAKEGSVMGGLVIEEEPVAVKGPDVNERDRRGMGLRTESLARVEAELKRLRELYPVRERERERTPNRRREVQEGETPGSLYDRDGFLKD